VADWYDRFWQLRRQQAVVLEALARRAVRADRASLAFGLVLAAIRENPDQESIRHLLGYQKFRGAWHTLYEIERLKSGQVWHNKFGWVRKEDVARYSKGMRPAGKRWIAAGEDAKRHQDITSGWDVETEHYTIRTDVSLEAGVALGAKLENLFRVWTQLFVRFFATEAQVSELFDKRTGRRAPLTRFRVAYFRDRDEYNRCLRPLFAKNIEQLERSIGVYDKGTRCAYFFAGNDYRERTMYHEATHQLFQESRPVSPEVGQRANFWIIEGIAMYMESLHEEDGFYVLGGFDDLRMNAARVRLLNDRFYIPLAELCSYTITQLQADARIATIYSQSAGLTHFLVHYEGGKYRDSLVAYLVQVYNGQDNPQTLAQLTGTPLQELDRQYRQFMERGDGKPKTDKQE
jgi:hypothetical protein